MIQVKAVGVAALAAVASTILGMSVMRLVRFRDTLLKIGLGLAFLGPFVVRAHLCFFDRLYLRWGKLERIVKGTVKSTSHSPPKAAEKAS